MITAHIPTLLLIIVVAGTVLALSVTAVASRDQRDGMTYWAAGLALHTGSYVFFSQVDVAGEFVAFLMAIVLRSCAWAAFTEGLCQFYRRPPPRVLIWAPVAAAVVSFVVLFDHLVIRVFTSNLIFAGQSVLAFVLMWRARRATCGRGQYFLMTGMAMATTLLTLRALGAVSGRPAELISVTGTNPVQAFGLIGALIALILLSIGFLLMSKDRADALNRQLATQDELTGLANRRCFNDTLAKELARSGRSEQPLALVMIDIDNFKSYNDRYGHQAGDVCLRQVADVLASGMRRAGDLAARYGGEEFVLILPNTDATEAQYLADSVRQSVEALNLPHLGSAAGKVTISGGVAAMFDGLYPDAERLLQAADEALYRAKGAGRNRIQLASALLRQDAPAHVASTQLVQLKWRRAYESGHPVIDTQHLTLFDDVNKLLGALFAGQSTAELAPLVDLLVADIRRHFDDEEAILQKAGFAGTTRHAELHSSLLDKAVALADRCRSGNLPTGELLEYLAYEVVARHILTADRAFFAELKSKN